MLPTTKTTLTICIVVLVCVSTACTTMRPIAADASGDSIRREIKPGDTVRVVTKGGPVHSFQITVVGATSLGGSAVKTWAGSGDPAGSQIDVLYSDIAELDVKRTSGLKTAGLVAAAVLVVVAIASGGGSHQVGYGSR
ncbi:MAG: hypothetical protein WA747_13800 [Steroidobacteraceae bacterium]